LNPYGRRWIAIAAILLEEWEFKNWRMAQTLEGKQTWVPHTSVLRVGILTFLFRDFAVGGWRILDALR